MTALPLPDSVRLVEVGLRDGLQAVPQPVSTADKVRLVELLVAAGVREIEAVSFAHPKVLPQLADAEAVMAAVPRPDGVRYRGLVPNLRGAQRAADTGLHEIVALACTDETVTRINQNRTVDQVLAELPAIARVADQAGARFVVGVAMAFFAPGRGIIPAADRARVVRAAADAGAAGIYLASSAGMDDPGQIAAGVAEVRADHPHLEIGVHLHSRNGMALANALAALTAGVDWIEGAFAGIGGDLWFPGPPEVLGNVPFEDLLTLCQSLDVHTGIDLHRYLDVVRLAEHVTGRRSCGFVVRGGTREQLAGIDWDEVLEAHG